MEKRSLTARLPTYESAQRFLQIVDGAPFSQYQTMESEIQDQRGDPQNTVSWTDPEDWIPKKLTAESQTLALSLWRESDHLVNPRYTRGSLSLSDTHKLTAYQKGVFTLTEDGKRFIGNEGEILKKMDEYEGLLLILTEVAEKSLGRRSDFLDSYREFCLAFTTYAAESSITSSLALGLKNLVHRKYIEKSGHSYQVTDAGLAYLQRQQTSSTNVPTPSLARAGQHGDPGAELRKLMKQINDEARAQLAQYLQKMNPYKFEELIKHLLEEMGYNDVDVTSPSNDKGVDVVADIEVGISQVREVIQVKRQKTNVGRRILDGLRGSLYRFDAMRATIITTGGFSKGAKDVAFAKGVAPITLIDGKRLLDLLIEHEIGVRKRDIEILEFDPEKLKPFETAAE